MSLQNYPIRYRMGTIVFFIMIGLNSLSGLAAEILGAEREDVLQSIKVLNDIGKPEHKSCILNAVPKVTHPKQDECTIKKKNTSEKSKKKLVLITAFTAWDHDFNIDSKEYGENATQVLVHRYTLSLNKRDPYEVEGVNGKYGPFCLSKALHITSNEYIKSAHRDYGKLSKKQQSDYLKKVLKWSDNYDSWAANIEEHDDNQDINATTYLKHMLEVEKNKNLCPKDSVYGNIYDSGCFDYQYIILPVDARIAAQIVEAFYEKYTKPLCGSVYQSCSILSLGEMTPFGFAPGDYRDFYVEEKSAVYSEKDGKISFTKGSPTGADIVKRVSDAYKIKTNRSFDPSTTCGELSARINTYCSDQKMPIPFLFIHANDDSIKSGNHETDCRINQSFDDVLGSLYCTEDAK